MDEGGVQGCREEGRCAIKGGVGTFQRGGKKFRGNGSGGWGRGG